MELYLGILAAAFLLMVCLLTSKVSAALNVPCMLLFLAVGMLAGSDGIGGMNFDNAKLANYAGSLAMAFILFSGGFDTDWKSVKKVLFTGGILSSLGVLLTALLVGVFAWGFFGVVAPDKGLSISWCILLGSIISSTDAAAVFSILRSRNVSLKGRLRPLLEFESGSNDPMAAFLTVFMVGLVSAEARSGGQSYLSQYAEIIPAFMWRMSVGALFGALIGWVSAWVCNRIDFEYNGLYCVFSVVVVLFAFALPEMAYGNGFMAVYVAGMVMGNKRFIFRNGIGKFYDAVAWMMQVFLFTMLGLFSFPVQVWDAKWPGIAVALFLMFVARPAAVFISMLGSRFSARERLLVSWVGLRGGAPIMLATFPLMANIHEASVMFNIVFFIVITSVLFQGMSIMPLAKLLKLDAPLRKAPPPPLSLENTGNVATDSTELVLPGHLDGKMVSELDLPDGVLILIIRRDENFIVPRGHTKLRSGDCLTLMGNAMLLERLRKKF